MKIRIGLVICLSSANSVAAQEAPADLLVTGATIYTADVNNPVTAAFAVRQDRIVRVGSEAEVLALEGSNTERLDLRGLTVIPGMIDAHAHLANLAMFLTRVDLVGTTSFADVIERVSQEAATTQRGVWIRGYGWDQNDWENKEFPTHEQLSTVVPNNPVFLERIDGHAVLLNALALDLVGINAATSNPEGGRTLRDEQGNPTGVLIDNAADSAAARIPTPSSQEIREAARGAIAHLSAFGLTGIHDASACQDTIEVFEEMAREGEFNLRSYIMVSNDDANLEHYLERGPQFGLYDGRIWIRSIKIQMDGALGSRGAALLEDYLDDPGNRGLLTASYERVHEVAVRALRNEFQLNVHAIGDRGNRIVLDAYEAALDEVPVADHRFRIEHAQILHLDDIARFAELGVIPSMQGSHQTSDMYWAADRVGPDRIRGAYAWRSLLDTGVIVPNGSDFPVESANPLISFRAFFTRRDADGWPEGGWHPEQRTSREEALLSMTLWPAQAAFMEDVVGSLSPGKYADFVVLDRDIMTVSEDQILETKVLMTFLGGRLIHERSNVSN